MAYNALGPGTPQRAIDFSVISESFNLLIAHWKVYCTAGAIAFLLLIPIYGLQFAFALVDSLSVSSFLEENIALLLVFGMLLMVAMLVIQVAMIVGVTKFTLNVSRGLPADVSDLWYGFKDPLGYIGAMILIGLMMMVGVLACFVGTLVVAGLTMFVFPIKVDQQVSATEAISQSWEMLKDEWLMASLFAIVASIIQQIGGYACGIGMIFTFSFLYIAPVLLYNRYTGHYVHPQQQAPGSYVSPYPRPGHPGYGAPPQDIAEGTPKPPRQDEQPRPPSPEEEPPTE